MSVRSFLDTNVFVYTDDTGAPEKQARALDLVERCQIERTGVVSTQVLQEYFVTTTKKLKVAAEVARRKTELLGRLELFGSDSTISWQPSTSTAPTRFRFGMP